VRGLAGKQPIGSVDEVDHAMWPLARCARQGAAE
jgi:hypothetical protein